MASRPFFVFQRLCYRRLMRLNIGGQEKREGWTILDVNPGPIVDIVGDIRDLSGIPSASCDEVYASHVLEHVTYRQELAPVLEHLFRILKPGSRLMVGVPDLQILCGMFAHPEMKPQDRNEIMHMIFGGQEDEHDRHLAGFNFQILGTYLHQAGFAPIDQVRTFGLFNDSSEMQFLGYPVSLNVVAFKPR